MTIMTKAPVAPLSRETNRLRNRLQRFFEEPFGLDMRMPLLDEPRLTQPFWSPAVEASETPTEYVITVELPGISPENVEVAVSEGMLTLKGSKLEERKEGEKDRAYHLWERSYGSFERSFRFPDAINDAKVVAEFSNGLLTVRVPKVEVAPPAVRTIPIAKK